MSNPFFKRPIGSQVDSWRNLPTSQPTLKAEIDADVWATLNSEIPRPFPMPKSGGSS